MRHPRGAGPARKRIPTRTNDKLAAGGRARHASFHSLTHTPDNTPSTLGGTNPMAKTTRKRSQDKEKPQQSDPQMRDDDNGGDEETASTHPAAETATAVEAPPADEPRRHEGNKGAG